MTRYRTMIMARSQSLFTFEIHGRYLERSVGTMVQPQTLLQRPASSHTQAA
ncbi:hypothetical protein M3J09_013515 [Ascochyta lentis]